MNIPNSVLVYGAGISGRGAAQVLAARGCRVCLYNDEPCTIPEELARLLAAQGGGLYLGSAAYEAALAEAELVVLSPGIAFDKETVVAAARRLPVISEVELAYRLYQGHMAAITGTNGKTTTTTLVGEFFRRLPVPSAVGGNIGAALSAEIAHLPPEAWVAAELSSFQLEGVTSFAPDIAVVLNLTPDHLERHHSMEAYGAAKQRIFLQQRPEQVALLNYDDPAVRSWARLCPSQVCFFSRKADLEQGICIRQGVFVIKWKDEERQVCPVSSCHLFGGHNEENILAALGCGYFAGVRVEDMAQVLASFKAVEHRLEFVRELEGVRYYNDSKATNTDSVIKALEAFPHSHIILIAGGYDKMTDLGPLMALVKEKTEALILLGAAQQRFYQAALAAGVGNIHLAASFEEGVRLAYALARPPQVVLLSPACSSYDMFQNYPQRGRYFKKLVAELPGEGQH